MLVLVPPRRGEMAALCGDGDEIVQRSGAVQQTTQGMAPPNITKCLWKKEEGKKK